MALNDALRLAQQYQQRGLDIQPQTVAAPPLNPMQAPPMMASGDSGNPFARAIGAGSQLLKGYMANRKKPEAGVSPTLPSASGLEGLMNEGSAPAAAFAMGGNWSKYLGLPVEVGEDGPETVVGQNGQAQTVGQQGPETVVPQQPATVVPNPATRARWAGGQPATPESSGISEDTTASRPRIADLNQFLRSKIADESSDTVQGPVWGSKNVGLDADGNPVKAPGRLHALLAAARAGGIAGAQTGGGWESTLAGAATGAALGGIKPEYGQLMDQQMNAQHDQARLEQLDKNQAASLSEGMRRAQIAAQYGNIGYKQGQLGVAQQRADTGDQNADTRAQRVESQNNTDTGRLGVSQDRAKTYRSKMEAEIELARRKILEPHVKTVQDPKTGLWFVINTDRETGQASTKPVSDSNGGQFETTPAHQLRVDEIAKRAAASGRTPQEAKDLARKASADSWAAAADEYERQAAVATQNGSTRAATMAKRYAIAARQKAAGFGWKPAPSQLGDASGGVQ